MIIAHVKRIQIGIYSFQDCVYHHPVQKISFIVQDLTDNRAFGYVFGTPDKGHRFFGIKTEKAASQVVQSSPDYQIKLFITKVTSLSNVFCAFWGPRLWSKLNKKYPLIYNSTITKSLALSLKIFTIFMVIRALGKNLWL